MNNLFLTIPAALLPSVVLLFYIYRKDLNREPISVVLWTAAFGVLLTIPVVIYALPVRAALAYVKEPYAKAFLDALFLAAVPEETFKLLLLVYFCMRRTAFDEEMDGLVYGAAASLGFAGIENVLYVTSSGMGTAIIRAVTSVPGHAALGVIMGSQLVKWGSTGKSRYFWVAMLLPIALHTAYDFPLMAMANLSKNSRAIHPAVSAGMIAMFLLLVKYEFGMAKATIKTVAKRQEDALDANVLPEIAAAVRTRPDGDREP